MKGNFTSTTHRYLVYLDYKQFCAELHCGYLTYAQWCKHVSGGVK